MYRRKLSIVLMMLTIATIVIFQAYWLRKNYEEEKRVLTLRSNLLFRETVFKIQASKLKIAVGFNESIDDKAGFVSMINMMMPGSGRDSIGSKKLTRNVIMTLHHDRGDHIEVDSLPSSMRLKIFDMLSGVDSLPGPVPVKEISDQYARTLAKEGIHIPFQILVDTLARRPRGMLTDTSPDSQVTIGFTRPVEYRLVLGSSFLYMLRKVGPQILFSLILVAGTILSFLFLYRNWQRQRRLTELKNDFISNITHELKTPIATVSVAVEALRSFNALHDPVRTREYLDISASELQRLSLLVDKVLKLSLFERQEIQLKKDNFDLGLLVEETLASMRLQFEKSKAIVSYVPQPGSAMVPGGASVSQDAGFGAGSGEHAGQARAAPGDGRGRGVDFRLRADKLHLTSVIFNLLDNALKYSPQNPTIRVELGAGENYLELAVIDNGVGIPEIYRERIFEKFFRVPVGDRHDVKGYGLGLSYVSYVLERQGGEISVDSQEGIGSRFIVKIPRDHD